MFIRKINQFSFRIFLTSLLIILTETISLSQPRPTVIPATNPENSFEQTLKKWGFNVIPCQGNSAKIQYKGTPICVQATDEIPAGSYTYNDNTNQIVPSLSTAISDPKLQPANNSTQPLQKTPNNIDMGKLFVFTNLYDYSSCLDDILRLHLGELRRENNQITLVYGDFSRIHEKKSFCIDKIIDLYGNRQINNVEVFELFDLANFRATKLLAARLYPPLGIRQRAAKYIGYIYEMDRNNPDILRLAGKNPASQVLIKKKE